MGKKNWKTTHRFQNLWFHRVSVDLLPSKTYAFTLQKSHSCNAKQPLLKHAELFWHFEKFLNKNIKEPLPLTLARCAFVLPLPWSCPEVWLPPSSYQRHHTSYGCKAIVRQKHRFAPNLKNLRLNESSVELVWTLPSVSRFGKSQTLDWTRAELISGS